MFSTVGASYRVGLLVQIFPSGCYLCLCSPGDGGGEVLQLRVLCITPSFTFSRCSGGKHAVYNRLDGTLA